MRPRPLDLQVSHLQVSHLAVLGVCLALGGCETRPPGAEARFLVDDAGLDLGLSLPRLSGWEQVPDVELADADEGGTAMVLVRAGAPKGSPKISVDFAARADTPWRTDAFLAQNLKAMGDLERETGMRITRVTQKPFNIGPRRAHLVRHDFVMGSGDAQQALTQMAAILVVDGRGITVTAVGVTELFYPLADQITRLLTGVQLATTADAPATGEVKGPETPPAPGLGEPVDLGTLGGK